MPASSDAVPEDCAAHPPSLALGDGHPLSIGQPVVPTHLAAKLRLCGERRRGIHRFQTDQQAIGCLLSSPGYHLFHLNRPVKVLKRVIEIMARSLRRILEKTTISETSMA